MNVLIVIPARMDSERFPGKPLADLNGKPVLQHVWERAKETGAEVIITSPDLEIQDLAVNKLRAGFCRTSPDLPTGTHRVAQVLETASQEPDIIVNWQGDEPLVDPECVRSLIQHVWAVESVASSVATLVAPMPVRDRMWMAEGAGMVPLLTDTDVVKAAVSNNRCHWFSRAPMAGAMAHCGVYAFTNGGLCLATRCPPSELSKAERLEQLTWIENGLPIWAVEMEELPPAINRPQDLEEAEQWIKEQ